MSSSEVGAAWESKVSAWLSNHGFETVRLRGLEGPKDHGDIGGHPRWSLDCKDQATHRFGPWVAQARIESKNAQKPLSAVIVKRRGKPTKDAFVVMDLATWAVLENYVDSLEKDLR